MARISSALILAGDTLHFRLNVSIGKLVFLVLQGPSVEVEVHGTMESIVYDLSVPKQKSIPYNASFPHVWLCFQDVFFKTNLVTFLGCCLET